MSKEIYNEGRVVGYSAYEIYLKNHLLKYPNIAPASENQWLTANIGAGASMILKIDPMTQPIGTIPYTGDSSRTLYVYRATLPRASVLASATNLYASYFAGECEFNSNGWATKVIDYGAFISNTSTSSPGSGVVASSSVPYGTSSSAYDETKRLQMMDYMKIVDGGVVQAGEWPQTSSGQPFRDFMARFDQWGAIDAVSVVIVTAGKLYNGTTILISGFQDNFIISGDSSAGGSAATGHPQDGDFLGPACIPWACKLTFSTPTEYHNMKINYYTKNVPAADYRFIGEADYSSDGPFTEGGTQRPLFGVVTLEVDGPNRILQIGDVIKDPDKRYWKFSIINEGQTAHLGWSAISESSLFTSEKMCDSESVIDTERGNYFYQNLIYDQTHTGSELSYNPYTKWKHYDQIVFGRPNTGLHDASHTCINTLKLTTKYKSDPPALYYGQASQSDSVLYLNPVDVRSPGTVKFRQYPPGTLSQYKSDIQADMVATEARYPGTVEMLVDYGYYNDAPTDGIDVYGLNNNNELQLISDTLLENIEYTETETLDGVTDVTRNQRYFVGSAGTIAKKQRVKTGTRRCNSISLDSQLSTTEYSEDTENYSHPYVSEYKMYNSDSILADDYVVIHSSKIGTKNQVSAAQGWNISNNSEYLGVVAAGFPFNLSQPVVQIRTSTGSQEVVATTGQWVRETYNSQYKYTWNGNVWEKNLPDQYYDGFDTHTIASDNITWSKLFDALTSDSVIDILGDSLKEFKYNLPNLFNMNAYNGNGTELDHSKFVTLDIKDYDRIFVNKVPFFISSQDDIPLTTNNTSKTSFPGTGVHVTGSASYLQMNGVRIYFQKTHNSTPSVNTQFTNFGLGDITGEGRGLYMVSQGSSTWTKLI